MMRSSTDRLPPSASSSSFSSSSPTPSPPLAAGAPTLVGSNQDCALCIIPPSTSTDDGYDGTNDPYDIVALIKEINRVISRKQREMEAIVRAGNDESIRKIQSNRYEIFVQDASNKGSRYFDKMIQGERKRNGSDLATVFQNDDMKERLIQYATKQARRDPRIRTKRMDFQNFSLICSFGKAAAQHAHVDMLQPNYQFLLCLTDQSPATYFYDLEQSDTIRTVQDLRELWETKNEEEFPRNLATLIEKSDDASMLLAKFGSVLHPHAFFQRKERRYGNVPVGTVLSLPGGVVHAGPQTEAFRAVLFFTAAPADRQRVKYNPDAQFNNVVLTGLLIVVLWRTVGVSKSDRLYLLRRLATYIQEAGVWEEWEDHFRDETELYALIRKIRTLKNMQDVDKVLDKTATEDDFVFYHLQSTDLKGDFQLVSDDYLHAEYTDMKSYPVHIYKRQEDGRVLLHYTMDRAFEGHGVGQSYTLNMHAGQCHEKFNGTNGTLLDTDGSEIKCSRELPIRRARDDDMVATPLKRRRVRTSNDDWKLVLQECRRQHAQNPDATWFTQFETFWRDALSGSTFQKIMVQVAKLRDGKGIDYKHWPSNVWFHQNQTIDLSTDFEELLRRAHQYEVEYGKDVGKGKNQHYETF